jgi:indolepyruvate ferredoxin oxidoreductase beta subunit
VFAGVGGQGILLAAEIVGTAAVKAGYNVRVSEIHGMAQRGGAVVSHVRIGEKALAPTVLEGSADIIVCFEPIETLRNIKFASQKTTILVNTQPFKVSGAEYPDVKDILKLASDFTQNIVSINAAALAERAGTAVVLNVVMVGALTATGKLPIKVETLKEALHELVPAKYLDMNMKAFELGYQAVKALAKRSK